ncbi:MAG TPA: 2Fe-2S iron-sulfur cluster-binding protein, partial [Aquabacterium sp.]|nr:2Fe-2S iron-sulfur cluster-binding protein [Aquabacterium sp.]
QIMASQPGFSFHVVLSQERDLIDGELAGRLDGLILNAVVPDLGSRRVFACGRAGFVETARAVIGERSRGFEAEAFSPPALGLAADEAARPVQITLAQSGRTVTVSSKEALLPALEAHGLPIPYGCRMGICHTCSCNKVSGTTRDLQNGLDQDEPHSAVRLCVSSASTDLTLDL